MIQIPRSLARQLRVVLRKSVFHKASRAVPPPVIFRAGSTGLQIQAICPEVAVQYHQPGHLPEGTLVVPAEALAACEGRSQDLVTLELDVANGKVQVSWSDDVVPQTRSYDAVTPEDVPAFPGETVDLLPQPVELLQALAQAAATASQERIRYALDAIQLHGRLGQVIATDGRQLLIRSGFSLGWEDDVLIPALPVFGWRDLEEEGDIKLGRTKDWVFVHVGPWTLALSIQKDVRFPAVHDLVQPVERAVATWHLAPADAQFLVQTLPRLPGSHEEAAPITIEGNGTLAVRAKGEGQERVTEVLLARSRVTGRTLSYATNRRYLLRALKQGFTEMHVFSPDAPVQCRQDRGIYLWQGLSPESILPASESALRIPSDQEPSAIHPSERRHVLVSRNSRHKNGSAMAAPGSAAKAPLGHGHIGPLAEAESLQSLLRDVFKRACQLVSTLKRQRRQAQMVQSTLRSLRQLQHVGD
jgi:hypothetical protein